MQRYQELNPSSARIFINYNDSENPVTFSYPSKKSSFTICLNVFLKLTYNRNSAILLLIIYLFFILFLFDYTIHFLVISLGIVSLFPFIMALIFNKNKKLLKYMPQIALFVALMEGYGYNYIKVNKLDSKRFEVPIFDNNFLDYKMTQEFKKYIDKIEITEHNFQYIHRNIFLKKIKQQQDDYWKCIFYFKRIPKKGYLEVKFL